MNVFIMIESYCRVVSDEIHIGLWGLHEIL
jgi:hypothetical protein